MNVSKINFFAQDPTVLPFFPLGLPVSKIGDGPSDERIEVVDRAEFPQAKPDKEGNFLYSPGQFQFDGCEAFTVLKLGMNLYSKILRRALPFAFPGRVRILPHDDVGINAFYSRDDQAVHFLDFTSPAFKEYPKIPNQTLRMAQSLDVGAHEEVGHLLLDGLKPEYLNFELETQAFHEAFGDISAMILTLQFDSVIDRLLHETGGDLRKSNLVSRLGEEAGMAMQALSPHPDPNHFFLRDATFTMRHGWKYGDVGPQTEWSPKDEKRLGSEPHNFSRFFSGLWYEIFVNLFEQDPMRSQDPKTAIKRARDTATSLILRAVSDFAPETTGRFSEIAKAMLKADQVDQRGAHQKLLSKIFTQREILSKPELRINDLPCIRLHDRIRTRRAAEAFLEKHRAQLGIAKSLALKPLEDIPPGQRRFTYRNQEGETYLMYHVTEEKLLQGPLYRELHGAQYQVKGSLKLGFDKKGKLFHVATDFLTPEKHDRIQQNLRQCHENQSVALLQPGAYSGGPRHFFRSVSQHHKTPYFAYTDWKNGKMVLKRVPVFS